jgi:hypothetical protein
VRILFAVLWLILISVSPVRAQFNGCKAGFCVPGSTATSSYSGPGDVVSGATAFYGLRGYNNAYATGTNNAITIRRTSDSTTSNIVILANGNLDVATATTFCTSTTCFVTTIYDQVGTHNLTQATNSAQPQLTFNCLNTSLPCLTFTGSSSQQLTGAFTTSAQPNTFSYVGERTGTFTANNSIVGSNNGTQAGFGTTANLAFGFSGTVVTATAADSALHAVQAVMSGVSGSLNVDGTLTGSLNAGTNGINATITVGSSGVSTNFLTGLYAEVIVFSGSAVTPTNQATLCHNQRTYWGSGGSC